jgi:hypothetical protein
MIEGLDQLEDLERWLAGLVDAPPRAAEHAAPALLDVARAQWAAGQAPDGEMWPLTKDGRVALTSLTSKATARAEGAAVVIEVPDELAYHQHPRQPGHPQRRTVPEEGEELPAAWEGPLAETLRAELERR